MKPIETEHIGCKGKVRYETKDAAYLAIYNQMVESRGGSTILRTYKCKFCKGFHLTSSSIHR